MSVAALLVLALAAEGFWESKSAAEWSVEEVRTMLESSPWSRNLRIRKDALPVHLATAAPMREAEVRERAFQKRMGAADASFAEYLAMIEEGKYIVLAVKIEDRDAFADGSLVSRMQKDTQMRVGKKAYPLVTHFPPSSSDPYLRLVFARPALAAAKSIAFSFVVPGSGDPYRTAEFLTKDLNYKGKLEY